MDEDKIKIIYETVKNIEWYLAKISKKLSEKLSENNESSIISHIIPAISSLLPQVLSFLSTPPKQSSNCDLIKTLAIISSVGSGEIQKNAEKIFSILINQQNHTPATNIPDLSNVLNLFGGKDNNSFSEVFDDLKESLKNTAPRKPRSKPQKINIPEVT